MRLWLGVFVSLGITASFVACGSDDDPTVGPNTGSDGGAREASGPSSVADGSSTPSDTGPGEFREEEDLPCEGRTISEAFSLFVDATNGKDSPECGTREAPCGTMQRGIARAYEANKPKLVVGPGTYAESIELAGGLAIEGGWDVSGTEWTANCSPTHSSLATIEVPAGGSNVSVRATKGASVLRFLTIKSKAAAAPGETLIGLVALGPNVKVALDDSHLIVAAGGAGADGEAGEVASGTACETPGEGTAGADGTGGTLGSLTSTGYTPGAATAGIAGTAGNAGAAADPPGTLGYFKCVPGATCSITLASAMGGPGTAGCGGLGGAGGKPGIGGGSSIGILATDVMIVTYGGSVTTGGGGKGGNGGSGALGATGSAGAAGADVTVQGAPVPTGGQTPSEACGPSPDCSLTQPFVAIGAEAGGTGGNGGAGGRGGGGAGGWSISFAKFGSAALLASTSTVFTTGTAGPGGEPSGAEGLKQQQWP